MAHSRRCNSLPSEPRSPRYLPAGKRRQRGKGIAWLAWRQCQPAAGTKAIQLFSFFADFCPEYRASQNASGIKRKAAVTAVNPGSGQIEKECPPVIGSLLGGNSGGVSTPLSVNQFRIGAFGYLEPRKSRCESPVRLRRRKEIREPRFNWVDMLPAEIFPDHDHPSLFAGCNS